MKIEEAVKGRYRNEYHKGIINLTFTTNELNHRFYTSLKKHDLSIQQYNILRVLRGYSNQAPLSISFLKERMVDRSSDVSRIIDRLVNKELVVRKECESDRRQKDIDISNKGLQLLKKLDASELEVGNLLSNLQETEVKELNRLLDKIRNNTDNQMSHTLKV